MTRTWRRLCPPVAAEAGATALVVEPRSGAIVLLVPGPAGDGELWTWSADRFTRTAGGFFGTRVGSVAAAPGSDGGLVFYGGSRAGLLRVQPGSDHADRLPWGERARARLVAVTHVEGLLRVLLDDGTVLGERDGGLDRAGAFDSRLKVVSGTGTPEGFVALLDTGDRVSWTGHTGWTGGEPAGDLRQLLPGGVARTAKGWTTLTGEPLPHPPAPEDVITAVLGEDGTPFVLSGTDVLATGAGGHPWGLRGFGGEGAATTAGGVLRVALAGDSPGLRVLGRDGRWTARTLPFDPDRDPDGDERDDWGAPGWLADIHGGGPVADPEETAHVAPMPGEGVLLLDRLGRTWLLDEAGSGRQTTLAPSEAALAGLRPDSRDASDLVRLAVGTERAVLWHGRTGRVWTLSLGYSPRIVPRWQPIRGDGPRAGRAALCVSGAGTHLFAEGELWLLKRHGWQWLGGQKDWPARSLFVHDGQVWSVGADAVGRWNGAAFEEVADLPDGRADYVNDPLSGQLLAMGVTLGTSGLPLP